MDWHVEIELSIALYDLRSPCSIVSPFEMEEAQGAAMVLPVDHVVGGEESPFVHPEEVGSIFIVTCEDVKAVAMHYWCGVGGEARLCYWVLCYSRCGCEE